MAPKNKKQPKEKPKDLPGRPTDPGDGNEWSRLDNGPGSGVTPIFPERIHPDPESERIEKGNAKKDEPEDADKASGTNLDYSDLFML